MGLIDALAGRRTYVDANIFIYLFEDPAQYGAALRPVVRSIDDGRLSAATSELSLAEVLVRPIRERPSFIPIYHRYLRSRPFFDVLPVTRAVLVEAARLRAAMRLKLPDAIHAATAQQAGCEVFLTNDGRINTLPGLDVLQLKDLV